MKFHELLDEVKSIASGRWAEIISSITRFELPLSKNLPCPKCGGTDRFFKLSHFSESGALRCRQCPEAGDCADGVGSVAWLLGITNQESLHKIADYLGIETKKQKKEPTVKFEPSEFVAPAILEDIESRFLPAKKGITRKGLNRAGILIGKFRPSWNHANAGDYVIAFPYQNEQGETKKHCMMLIDGKKFHFKERQETKLCTSKLANCEGYCGSIEGETVFITEGETDLAALYSILPDGKEFSAITTGGSSARILHWLTERLSDKNVFVIFDSDPAGEKGAEKLCRELASNDSITVKNIRLDGEKIDLREWMQIPGNGFDQLQHVCETTGEFEPSETEKLLVSTSALADRDPLRLAMANLSQYESGGKRLIYFQDRWFRYDRDHYEEIEKYNLETKVRWFLQQEFIRIHENEVNNWTGKGEPPKHPEMVTTKIVTEVLKAMATQCQAKSKTTFPGWIDDPGRPVKNIIPLKNGLIDLDVLLKHWSDEAFPDEKDFLQPHTSNFFSPVCLPYSYRGVSNQEIANTEFYKFLKASFPQPPRVKGKPSGTDYITLLQQWLGYLLVQDNTANKFLLMQGNGANGKTVFCTVIEALLGSENCAGSTLTDIAGRFETSFFYNRLVNIIDEASEIDKKTVDTLKRLTGGGICRVEKKGKTALFTKNVCRFIICCNEIPQFKDTSDGISRRMIFIPWEVQVPIEKQKSELITTEYWQKSGELPVIFGWALQGLIDYQREGRFRQTEEMLEDSRELSQSSPEKDWLARAVEITDSVSDFESTADLFSSYEEYIANRRGIAKFSCSATFSRWLKEELNRDPKQKSTGLRSRGFEGVRLRRRIQ